MVDYVWHRLTKMIVKSPALVLSKQGQDWITRKQFTTTLKRLASDL